MDFVFLMMKGPEILSVDIIDLEKEGLTIEKAALQLLDELEFNTAVRPTGYAVLGSSDKDVWLLQQTILTEEKQLEN